MKKIKITFLMSLLILNIITIASAEVVDYNYDESFSGTQITQLKYEPYPVNPGEYFKLWIKINLGSSSRDAKFELLPEFPFSLDSNEKALRSFGSGSGEVVVEYKIRVDKNAVEGENELKFKYASDGKSENWITGSFDIQIENVQTDFDLIIQESSGTDYSIAIANIGKNTANSLIVRIPEQESYKISGTNGQMVGNLESGDYTLVSFSISPIGRNTESLKVQLDYTDSIGERRSLIKEVGSLSTSPVSNNNETMPDYGNFQRGNIPMQQESIFKSYWFWGIIILILTIIIILAVKYPNKRKEIISKFRNKSRKDAESKTPEWILTEKTKKK
ncbi:MAG: hypothetical protein WC494_03660 [Candidatus Pacearchaeota archaeon]